MGFDDIIVRVGEFGRYHREVYLILCLPLITSGIHKMGGVFLAATVDFRCLLPHENPENVTYHLPPNIANAYYPWDDSTGSWTQCERYDLDIADQTPSILKCDTFVYNKIQYELTATTEWNLVCDRAWLSAWSQSIYMAGAIIGATIFGGLSDRFGRRLTLFWSLIAQLICGLLAAASPDLISYMVFRLLTGAINVGVFIIAYVIALEMVSPKNRLIVGTACQLLVAAGQVVMVSLAYFIRDWRTFTLPSIVFIAYRRIIPESIRWLLSKDRVSEARDMLHKAAKKNGITLSQDMLDSVLNENKTRESHAEKPTVLHLFRSSTLRRKTLLLFFIWFVNGYIYYGLSWNSANMKGNDYLNFGITTIVEAPAYVLLLLTLNRWGRRIILCQFLLLAGTSTLLMVLVSALTEGSWLTVLFSTLGKFAIICAFGVNYVFTTEQYPTPIRNVGLGACTIGSTLGAVLTPLYINYLTELWLPAPLVLFGTCTIISGLLTLLLPETLDTILPEGIQNNEPSPQYVFLAKKK